MKNIAVMVVDLKRLGGTQRVAAILSNELSNYYNCNIITLFGSSSIYSINDRIKIYDLNSQNVRFRYSALKNLLEIKKLIIENKIEILIVVGRICTIIPLLLKFICKIKIIFCEHASKYEYTFIKETFKVTIVRHIFNFLLKENAKKIVYLTNKELEMSEINHQKILKIYNSIDEKLLKDIKEYNIGAKKIITVGRLDYGKGIDLLIQVAKKIFLNNADWQWHIYGDGDEEYTKHILDLIKQNNLKNNVILKGKNGNIYDVYQDYSFFVMTSRYEGLPMVLLEAKAKKLPIISFDINSGPSDIIRDEIDGFLIKPFDCEAMAEKICTLIENPELRQKLSNNAHGNLDKFSKEKVIKQWCDLIDGL